MAFKKDITGIKQGINIIDSGLTLYNRTIDFDLRYQEPDYWKLDKFNNLTNTWCTFYLEDLPEFANTLELNVFNPNAVTVFGVSIALSKSPKIIETHVKGFGSPVYQQFDTGSFDITINFLETGSTFWQQNSRQIEKLINILDQPQTLNISNPQLNLVYDINQVVVKGYSIGQDERFYSHNPISITLKSDISTDILKPAQA